MAALLENVVRMASPSGGGSLGSGGAEGVRCGAVTMGDRVGGGGGT